MQLTVQEAYNPMVQFLDNYYQRTNSDDIGSLLSDLMILHDGSTAEPAAWEDWLKSIEQGKDKTQYLEFK